MVEILSVVMNDESRIHSFVRVRKLKTRAEIGAMSKHAKGLDVMSRARARPDTENRAAGWRFDRKPEILDVSNSFECYLKAKGDPGHHKGSALAVYFLIGVSPDWVAQTGDIHSTQNPRVRTLLNKAANFVENEFDGVWNARYDLDETGGGVVDVFASPIAKRKNGGRDYISIAKAMEAFAARRGVSPTHSYTALQDAWAEFAGKELDPMIVCGRPKAETAAQYMRPEEYKDMEAEKLALKQRGSQLRAREKEVNEHLVRRDLVVTNREHSLDSREWKLDDRTAEVRNAEEERKHRAAIREREAAEEAANEVKKLLSVSLVQLKNLLRMGQGAKVAALANKLLKAEKKARAMARTVFESQMRAVRGLQLTSSEQPHSAVEVEITETSPGQRTRSSGGLGERESESVIDLAKSPIVRVSESQASLNRSRTAGSMTSPVERKPAAPRQSRPALKQVKDDNMCEPPDDTRR